jgi:hypothetical protein
MATIMAIEEEVGADGRVVLHLPPGQRVRITVEAAPSLPELTPEEEAVIDAEIAAIFADPNFGKGLGLRSDEIARLPEVGSWAHRTDIVDSVEYVQELRRKRRNRRLNRED